ncbi:rRNA-processing protein cgrA [Exophiala mesophila]|uniref:rRNA-processing protein n=1 Tax=Exophiala mesophila TaxID=212818 RepID=A0A438NA48_EXOME|nr:rRNA-processing protein cgrA [Exophiala mesophila]
MSTLDAGVEPVSSSTSLPEKARGMRVNGKNWHAPKKAFRPNAGQVSYAKRKEQDKIKQVTKARELEMKQEKEQERDRRIQAIKDRRKAKEEKERYDKMAEKMHRKLVERRKRREKRNKLLNS